MNYTRIERRVGLDLPDLSALFKSNYLRIERLDQRLVVVSFVQMVSDRAFAKIAVVLNQTMLEVKCGKCRNITNHNRGLNRTMLGLKDHVQDHYVDHMISLNRTMLGLKLRDR